MTQFLVRTFLFGLLLLVVLAPFAGLAPLLLVLLTAGILSAIWSFLKILLFGKISDEQEEVN